MSTRSRDDARTVIGEPPRRGERTCGDSPATLSGKHGAEEPDELRNCQIGDDGERRTNRQFSLEQKTSLVTGTLP